jgi:hypothetical protein
MGPYAQYTPVLNVASRYRPISGDCSVARRIVSRMRRVTPTRARSAAEPWRRYRHRGRRRARARGQELDLAARASFERVRRPGAPRGRARASSRRCARELREPDRFGRRVTPPAPRFRAPSPEQERTHGARSDGHKARRLGRAPCVAGSEETKRPEPACESSRTTPPYGSCEGCARNPALRPS